MKINIEKKQIKELLNRGVNEVIDYTHLKKQLLLGRKLKVKLGIDPTNPNIHLGHLVVLLKLRDFQRLGHQAIFIIGDFTAIIGDVSDKGSERPMLTEGEVQKNMRTYLKQVEKILDIDKTEIYYNSKWLKKLGYSEIGKQADQFSLIEFINRENIKRRLAAKRRVSLREVLYPLMQGYDSVVVKADVEIGGIDQRFNLLVGRRLQVYYKQSPQDILMTNLIPGTDGKKMSKSQGNTIDLLNEPNDMFGKIMSLSDNLIINYFEHCTRVPMERVRIFKEQLEKNTINPRDIKMDLAYEITKLCWGEKNAISAKNYFVMIFQKKEIPSKIPEIKLVKRNIIDVLVQSKLAKSRSEARRLINQKGIKIDGKLVESANEIVERGRVLQKGKRHFIKII